MQPIPPKNARVGLALSDSTKQAWSSPNDRPAEDYPDERLIACRNPFIAQKNQLQREALLEAVEKELDLIVQATQREKRALKGQDKIALRVGKVLNQFKVNKYYNLEITEEGFSYQRKLELIAQETALDGVYVLRTSVLPNLPCKIN